VKPICSTKISRLLLVLAAICLSGIVNAQLLYIETANGARSSTVGGLVQWTHSRMVFQRDLTRVAVGKSETLEVEILGGRELLLLAKEVGRTSVIVWYDDDTTETFLFNVVQDLDLLESALRDLHPNIRLELAPDRAALVLRGLVPTLDISLAAESIAQNYLSASGSNQRTIVAQAKNNDDDRMRVADPSNGAGSKQMASTVINLIQVEALPQTVEFKIAQAIAELGGADVDIDRIQRGDIEDNSRDLLMLSGQVQNQITLVRVLNIAAGMFVGVNINDEASIQVLADESGSLIGGEASNQSNSGGGGGGGGGIGGFGGNQSNLRNEISSNVGRAKLLSVAGGRILSTIEVRDLPQVRVAVQMHEVDRNRMRMWKPNLTAVTTDYNAGSSFGPEGAGLVVQPDASLRVGAGESTQIDNALQVINGSLTNNFQVGGSDLAFDLLFSLLETDGISQVLSRPTLTVLAGESAVFQVGGEVPIPSSFSPVGVDSAGGGVFNNTEFRAFGVQLTIRPMVGEDDLITLDVRPTVSLPDVGLTQQIAGSTGTNLNSTAFNTRSLETTTRLRDGQTIVLGGLVSRSIRNDKQYTPGANSVPLAGALVRSSETSDNDRELIIIVTPTIVREPREDVALWAFPTVQNLLFSAVGLPEGVDVGGKP